MVLHKLCWELGVLCGGGGYVSFNSYSWSAKSTGVQGLLPSFPSQLHSRRTKRTVKNKVYVGSNKFWMPQITVFLSIT